MIRTWFGDFAERAYVEIGATHILGKHKKYHGMLVRQREARGHWFVTLESMDGEVMEFDLQNIDYIKEYMNTHDELKTIPSYDEMVCEPVPTQHTSKYNRI